MGKSSSTSRTTARRETRTTSPTWPAWRRPREVHARSPPGLHWGPRIWWGEPQRGVGGVLGHGGRAPCQNEGAPKAFGTVGEARRCRAVLAGAGGASLKLRSGRAET